VDYMVFEKNLLSAADQIVRLGGVNIGRNEAAIDYDSMSKEDLLEECVSRGMKTSFPKVKRIGMNKSQCVESLGMNDVCLQSVWLE